MIFETDEESRDFITIYKKDYHSKRCKKLGKYIHPPYYKPPLNPLNGPFKEYLNSIRQNERVSPEDKTEDIGDNLSKIRSKYKHLGKFIPDTPPNEDVIEADQKKAFKTVYQLDYSQNLDDYLSIYAKRTGLDRRIVTLPKDWIIPETVQKRSYRNPRELAASENLSQVRKYEKPTNNLDPNEKERKILRVVTGKSEYDDVIGKTGDRIFRERLHGIPFPM